MRAGCLVRESVFPLSRWIVAALLGFCLAVGVVALVRSAPPTTTLDPRKIELWQKDYTRLECLGRTCTAVGFDWYHLWWDIPANRSAERQAFELRRPDGSIQTTFNQRPGAAPRTFSVGWHRFTEHPMFIFARGPQLRANEMPALVWSQTGTLRLPNRGTWYVSAWIDHCWSSPCPKATSFTYGW